MESDLTKICLAIPAAATGDVSTQASAVLKALTGENAEFHIGGGDQPKLFDPSITKLGYNQYSWSRNTRNGAFTNDNSVKGFINGVEVTAPLLVTSELSGVTLTVTETAEDFQPGVKTAVLEYTPAPVPTDYLSITPDFSTLTIATAWSKGAFITFNAGKIFSTYMHNEVDIDTLTPIGTQYNHQGICVVATAMSSGASLPGDGITFQFSVAARVNALYSGNPSGLVRKTYPPVLSRFGIGYCNGTYYNGQLDAVVNEKRYATSIPSSSHIINFSSMDVSLSAVRNSESTPFATLVANGITYSSGSFQSFVMPEDKNFQVGDVVTISGTITLHF